MQFAFLAVFALVASTASADPPAPMPFFVVAKMDAELCNNIPPGDMADITKMPQTDACKGKAEKDQVCICIKPTPTVQKMLEDKKAPANKNGFMAVCGSCNKDLKWMPA